MYGDTFVFFGIAGSGKGTQVELLKGFLHKRDLREIVYAYPGAEYRHMIAQDTYTSKRIKDSIEKGELQPDFLTTSIVANILASAVALDKHLIVDGYPRTLPQSKSFEEMMNFYQRENVKIIYIEVNRDEAMKRNLARARHDDTPDVIAKRFDEYVNHVIPAMDYFKNKAGYQVYTINGEQPVEKVHQDIITALQFK